MIALAILIDAGRAGDSGHGHDTAQVVIGRGSPRARHDAGIEICALVGQDASRTACSRATRATSRTAKGSRSGLGRQGQGLPRLCRRNGHLLRIEAFLHALVHGRAKERQNNQAKQNEPKQAGQAARLLGVQIRRVVELENLFVVFPRAFGYRFCVEQTFAAVVPLIDDGKAQICHAPDMQMPVCQRLHVAVHQHDILRNQDEINAHMPVRLKRLNVIGHLGASWARGPDFLHFVETNNCARLRPQMPVTQPLIVPAIDQHMVDQQTLDVGIDDARMKRHDTIDLLRDGGADDGNQEFFNSVKGFSCAGSPCYYCDSH